MNVFISLFGWQITPAAFCSSKTDLMEVIGTCVHFILGFRVTAGDTHMETDTIKDKATQS